MNNLGLGLVIMAASGLEMSHPYSKRYVPQTPEPQQAPEQKEWYLERARLRREKRAEKKRKHENN